MSKDEIEKLKDGMIALQKILIDHSKRINNIEQEQEKGKIKSIEKIENSEKSVDYIIDNVLELLLKNNYESAQNFRDLLFCTKSIYVEDIIRARDTWRKIRNI